MWTLFRKFFTSFIIDTYFSPHVNIRLSSIDTHRVSTCFICLHGSQIIMCIVQGRKCGQVLSYIRYNIRTFHSHGAWLEQRYLFWEEFRKELQRYSQEVKSLALQLKLTTNRSSLQLLARRVVGVYLKIKPIYPFPFFELSDLITQDSSLWISHRHLDLKPYEAARDQAVLGKHIRS